MASEKKIAANRKNAQKSTGPKTAEGKARSRRNALKHGLSGGMSVLPPEDLELFAERLQGWTRAYGPQDEMEGYLLAGAVLATVRMDRCARKEFTEISDRRQKAISLWDRRQDYQLDRLTNNLADDPEETLEGLRSFVAGHTWLLEAWQDLESSLQAGRWTASQTQRAMLLIDSSDDTMASLEAFAACEDAELDLDALDACLQTDTSSLDPTARLQAVKARLPEPAEARANWLARIARVKKELTKRRADLWYQEDGPALADAINLATFDDSPAGALCHRYEQASSLRMHRALIQLRDRRRQRDRDRNSDTPPPGWSGSEMAHMVTQAVRGLRPEQPDSSVEQTGKTQQRITTPVQTPPPDASPQPAPRAMEEEQPSPCLPEASAAIPSPPAPPTEEGRQVAHPAPEPIEATEAEVLPTVTDVAAGTSVESGTPTQPAPAVPKPAESVAPAPSPASPDTPAPRAQTPQEWREEARRLGQSI